MEELLLTPFAHISKGTLVIKRYWPQLKANGIIDTAGTVVREAKALKTLSRCKNIVGYVCTLDDGDGIIMNYYPYNLSTDILLSLDISKRDNITLGIAAGIKHMHSNGIVRNDLKPSNILLDSDFTPKICDFGSCSIEGEPEISSQGLTPRWAYPEASEEFVPHKSYDIYSFGLLFLYVSECYIPYSKLDDEFLLTEDYQKPDPDLPVIRDRMIREYLDVNRSKRPRADTLYTYMLMNGSDDEE